MTRVCDHCGRPKGKPYHFKGICDTVFLSDGREVHRNRVEIGGDLHDEIHEFGLKIISRNFTPEMRSMMKKEKV